MGLKSGRTIVVRDISFQWKPAHPSVQFHGDSPRYMDIIVHTVEGHGRLRARIESSLWVEEYTDEYLDGMRTHRASVTPKDVRAVIEKALDDGWNPVPHGQWELAGPLKLQQYQVRTA